MAEMKMQLVDWLDDLCVRFIINLPQEELASVERICFQIEEAQWFYEDFIRPLDPSMPSMNLKKFCSLIFQHCPILAQYANYHAAAYSEFLAYKTRVPVRGAIMLNSDMSEVVLVKGWKKGAKWSFPRGKINKDENDLDCAVREVYEETGFDIREAGLVPDEEPDAKYIEVSLREQHMRLYVFRGVPMETYFEPRTRKEISKIQWYKLADLPTLKKEKHLQQHAPNGEEALKGSHFYMVAPFIRPLKNWIKQQRQLDRQQDRVTMRKPVVLEEDTTEAEEDVPFHYDHGANEVHYEMTAPADGNHFQRLLSGLGGSNQPDLESPNLPEVSAVPTSTADLAAELKRMLSIGGPVSAAQPQAIPQDTNPLLSILRGSNPPSQGSGGFGVPPHTPADQIKPTPPLAHTPHHHHPRPPPFANAQPPPPFPYSPPHENHGNQGSHPHGPRPYPHPHNHPHHQQHVPFNNGIQGKQPGRQPHPQDMPLHPPHHNIQTQGPSAHSPQAPPQIPKPYQRTGDPQFTAQFPQYSQAPSIPPASQLPPPKLTHHALNLLNVFKSPAAQNAQPQLQAEQAANPNRLSHSGLEISGVSVPVPPQTVAGTQPMREQALSPPRILQPKAQKPRSHHQDALLNLFRAPSTPAVPIQSSQEQPPSKVSQEPVELSAQPSPQVPRAPQHKLSMRRLPALDTAPSGQQNRSPGLTSATVSGPLNAPDFDTVKKQKKPAELGNGASVSPKRAAPPQQHFHPTAILSRAPAKQQPVVPPVQPQSPPVPIHTVTNRTAMEAPRPFHPTTILRRQEQSMTNMMPPQPQAPPPKQQQPQPSFDRRDHAPNEQKQTLMNLFGGGAGAAKPTPPPAGPSFSARGNTPQEQQKQTLLHLFGGAGGKPTGPPAEAPGSVPVSALPGNMSGVGSPVSPLPSHATLAKQDSFLTSPPTSAPGGNRAGGEDARSRISSITSVPGGGEPAAAATSKAKKGVKGTTGGDIRGSGTHSPITPTEKNFLLDYLQGVVKDAPKSRQGSFGR